MNRGDDVNYVLEVQGNDKVKKPSTSMHSKKRLQRLMSVGQGTSR